MARMENAAYSDERSALVLDGVTVSLFRDDDGIIVVQVLTHDAEGRDVWPGTGVPKIALVVNDRREELAANGEWVREAVPVPSFRLLPTPSCRADRLREDLRAAGIDAAWQDLAGGCWHLQVVGTRFAVAENPSDLSVGVWCVWQGGGEDADAAIVASGNTAQVVRFLRKCLKEGEKR